MKKKVLLTIAICACALSLAPVCEAGDYSSSSSASDKSSSSPSSSGSQLTAPPSGAALQSEEHQLRSVTKLLSKQVKDQSGTDLGEISDIYIDTSNGQVAYLIVSSGAIMGMGGTDQAVPFRAVAIDAQNQLTISMDLSTFKQAPLRQEDLADREWGLKVHEFFGVSPYWEESSPPAGEMQMHIEKQMEKTMHEQMQKNMPPAPESSTY